jgi:hypothetical protein
MARIGTRVESQSFNELMLLVELASRATEETATYDARLGQWFVFQL